MGRIKRILLATGYASFVFHVLTQAQNVGTLPPTPQIEAAFDSVKIAYYTRQADSRLLMESFLNRFQSSSLVPRVRLMMANQYYFAKEYPPAVETFRLLSPEMFSGEEKKEMMYRYAFSLVKTGYYEEAASLFQQLTNDKVYRDASVFHLAYIDYINGNFESAYQGFKEVENSDAQGLEAIYYINQIDYRRGEYEKVIKTSKRLLKGDVPEVLLPETMRVAGASYFKLGDKRSAEPLLQEYVDIRGDGAENSAIYSLATILYDKGDYSSASKLFKTLTDNRDELAQSSWLYIGQISVAEGDPQSAALAFDKASRESWNPDIAEKAAYNLALVSASGGRLPFSASAQTMENFIASYPESAYSDSLSYYLANAYYNEHDYANALRMSDRLSKTGNDDLGVRQKILYQYGVSMFQQGKTSEAIKYLKEASESKMPDSEVSAQASLWLGDAYYSQKNYRDAVEAYKKAVASKGIGINLSLANYDLGYGYMKLKDYKQARGAFEKALKGGGLTASQLTDARLRAADCLYYTGSYNEALKEFRQLATGSGQDAVYASIREADILGRQGKVDEKIKILQRTLDAGDAGVWESVLLSRLGDAYSEAGNDVKAAEIYSRILDSDDKKSDRLQVYYSLAANADNLLEKGDRAAALSAFRRLEQSGLREFYPLAVIGIMRSSDDPREISEYSKKVMALPGISAEESDEAMYLGALAVLSMKDSNKALALDELRTLADSADRNWGAKAGVAAGKYYIDNGQSAEAEKILLATIDAGTDDSYTLAQAYILLSDAYMALDKDYLARLYLENLRANYPGKESDIFKAIDSRLRKIK